MASRQIFYAPNDHRIQMMRQTLCTVYVVLIRSIYSSESHRGDSGPHRRNQWPSNPSPFARVT